MKKTKTALLLIAMALGGLFTGMFSPYALMFLGPDRFSEGSPFVLGILGLLAGVILFFGRKTYPVKYVVLPLVLAVAASSVAFLVLGVDITQPTTSLLITGGAVVVGLLAARALKV